MKIPVICLVMLFPVFASAVKVVRNGGDFESLEFVAMANRVASYLETQPMPGIDLEQLRRAIKETKVESTEDTLFLEGQEKDAINDPVLKTILFNSRVWSSKSEDEKPAFVAHEYFGIMGVDDARYEFSHRLLGMTLVGGVDAIYLADIFKEHHLAPDRAVWAGCHQYRDSNMVPNSYDCYLEHPSEVASLRIVRGRKARELWTFMRQFGPVRCSGKSCMTFGAKITCKDAHTAGGSLAFCHFWKN